jgi:LacI family transcriptional regulator
LTKPKTGTPTIIEVALAAGVSRATVSRTFSRPELLTSETIECVRAVATQLGYILKQVAWALSTGRARNIALIVPDIANPFFPPLIRAAQARADEASCAVFLGDSDEAPEREDVLLTKIAAQVDGFILTSPRLDEQRIRTYATRRPLILINRDIEGLPRVLMDVDTGVTQAITHLTELGHRHIAYVSGPPASWANQQRQKAAVKAARRLGLTLVGIAALHSTYQSGQAAAPELLKTDIIATVAFDNLMAQGIIAGLADRGLQIPQDMSVVGFNDVLAARTYPPLTTLAAHCAKLGVRAVELLVEILESGRNEAARIVIPTELIVRATTSEPAKLPSSGRKSLTAVS